MLYLCNNGYVGIIFEEFVGFIKLWIFDVYGNFFVGMMFIWLFLLIEFEVMDISDNIFGGEVDGCIFDNFE